MRKKVYLLFCLLTISLTIFAQENDPLVSNCLKHAGTNARYLKDFRIELGKATIPGELRYKTNMSLWKNTRYRFTLCNSDESGGQLILNVKDDSNTVVASSVDQKSGKTYTFVDLLCNKSGIYQLCFDFEGGKKGSGIGVVSMIK